MRVTLIRVRSLRRLCGGPLELDPSRHREGRLERQHDIAHVLAVHRDLRRRPQTGPGRSAPAGLGARPGSAASTASAQRVEGWSHRARPAGPRHELILPRRDIVEGEVAVTIDPGRAAAHSVDVIAGVHQLHVDAAGFLVSGKMTMPSTRAVVTSCSWKSTPSFSSPAFNATVVAPLVLLVPG